MNAKQRFFAYSGIYNYIIQFDIGEPKNKSKVAFERLVNKILIRYLKEKGLRYIKWGTPGYKGTCQPIILNCCEIQKQGFQDFSKWLNKLYHKK